MSSRTLLGQHPSQEQILEFCGKDPVRYRHISNTIASPNRALGEAMMDYYQMAPDPEPRTFYIERSQTPGLFATYRSGRLRVEGELPEGSESALNDWCRHFNLLGVGTTNEKIMTLMAAIVGEDGWSMNPNYSATSQTFRDCTSHDVVRLLPTDQCQIEAFLNQAADTPFLTIRRSDDSLCRDLLLMCAGQAVDCYGIRMDGALAGILTAYPMTFELMEISRLYVKRQYRGRGLGRSLLSMATRDILERGLQPACSTQGDAVIMGRLTGSLGYRQVCQFWHRRYWTCQRPLAQTQ